MSLLKILFCFLLAVAPFSYIIATEPSGVTERYISMALQGDLSTADQLFGAVRPESESLPVNELAERFSQRFIDRTEDLSPATGDELVDAIVSLYREYWVRNLIQPSLSASDGTFLEESLRRLLALQGPENPTAGETDVFDQVGAIFVSRGFNYLDTPAAPLRDLFLWKNEENRNYSVRLTDTTQRVHVTFMSDIYSQGWKEFATLGLVSTTGWVEGSRLYCVSWAYDRNSENFEVSYLKHESRHLADLERFPDLSSADLEYRAKLTELAFASRSLRRLLNDFTDKSAPNPQSPHAFANYRVIHDVYRAVNLSPLPDSGDPWMNVSAPAVARAARSLLEMNTASLESE